MVMGKVGWMDFMIGVYAFKMIIKPIWPSKL
jgi:hypothetical protein